MKNVLRKKKIALPKSLFTHEALFYPSLPLSIYFTCGNCVGIALPSKD